MINEANKVLLEEAQKNLTDYYDKMDPVLSALEEEVTTLTYNLRNATERNRNFEEYTKEIDGYMSILLGFVLGRNSIDADFYG